MATDCTRILGYNLQQNLAQQAHLATGEKQLVGEIRKKTWCHQTHWEAPTKKQQENFGQWFDFKQNQLFGTNLGQRHTQSSEASPNCTKLCCKVCDWARKENQTKGPNASCRLAGRA